MQNNETKETRNSFIKVAERFSSLRNKKFQQIYTNILINVLEKMKKAVNSYIV